MGLQLVQSLTETMRQQHGQGQIFPGLVGGVAHHDALIACADDCARLCFPYGIGNVERLVMDADFQFHLIIGAFAEVTHGIADAVDGIRDNPAAIHLRFGGDLAANDHLACRGENLYGDAGVGILPEMGVQNGVRNLVAELVGVAGTDGFRRDQPDVFVVHGDLSPFCQS